MPTCPLSGPTAETADLGVSDAGFIPSAALVLMTDFCYIYVFVCVYIYIYKYIDIYILPRSRGKLIQAHSDNSHLLLFLRFQKLRSSHGHSQPLKRPSSWRQLLFPVYR